MCGIFCCLHFEHIENQCVSCQINPLSHELLKNRGPNANSELTISTENCFLYFAGNVLWQQGQKLCKQPHVYNHHVLLINGDIFTKRDNCKQSDTEWLIKQLDKCQKDGDLLEFFRECEGPYSIVYYNRQNEKLYFIRDSLGRQSLLISTDGIGQLSLSSVLSRIRDERTESCIELPPLGLFSIDLRTKIFFLNPWQPVNINDSYEEQINELETLMNKSIEIRDSIHPYWLQTNGLSSEYEFNFEEILKDMINEKPDSIYQKALQHQNIENACEHLIELLKKSITDRINATPSYCRCCLKLSNTQCDHAKVGILFSGGIDCTILACLSDSIIDKNLPIDLINVSFEKIDRGKKKEDTDREIDYCTPDRISANETLIELQTLKPDRKWNLIEVNITRQELNTALESRITHLVYPLNSVLDESLGAVLWFGARGPDSLQQNKCRVLLLGSGADELFGGYTRHRNAFIRKHDTLSPYENLEKELEFDFRRLPSRNLARDDRVIGDCGITARSPFLEEEFVHFVRSLRANQKCYHSLEQGVGDKLLLRLCGYKLGLRNVTSLKKRAMQFGSRVADRKQNAKDIAKSLT